MREIFYRAISLIFAIVSNAASKVGGGVLGIKMDSFCIIINCAVPIAFFLVGKPSVLLADEPTGNLDFRTGEMIFELLGRLQRLHELTSILVTHNNSFARACDRILRLEGGVLVPVAAAPEA